MGRTRVRRRRLAAAGVLVAAWALGGPVAGAIGLGPEASAQARTYVVRPGDTLWTIAGRFEPDRDPREVVFALTEANRVDAGSLVPGQRLVVPSL